MKFGSFFTALSLIVLGACTQKPTNSKISEDQSNISPNFYNNVIRYEDVGKYPINYQGTVLWVYGSKSCSDCLKIEKNVLHVLASESKSANDYVVILVKAGETPDPENPSNKLIKELLNNNVLPALPVAIVKNNDKEITRLEDILEIAKYREALALAKGGASAPR